MACMSINIESYGMIQVPIESQEAVPFIYVAVRLPPASTLVQTGKQDKPCQH
jgi:hypothetical protein